MQFLSYEKVKPKPISKAAARRELKAILAKYTRGTSSSTRYDILIRAKRYANEHGLDFPAHLQRDLSSAAQDLLCDIVLLTYGEEILRGKVTIEYEYWMPGHA